MASLEGFLRMKARLAALPYDIEHGSRLFLVLGHHLGSADVGGNGISFYPQYQSDNLSMKTK
jgi:hypothetical protein